MGPMTRPASPRTPRRDATANRERLLTAAEEYFAEHGLDASLHALVDGIGMGIGTLYRHFPTREDLIAALYDRLGDGVDESIEQARRLPTGWATVVAYIDIGVDLVFRHPAGGAILERISRSRPGHVHGQRWEQPMIDAVARAHAEGSLRPDATAADVAYVSQLLGGLATMAEPARSMLLARQRALLLDGLRDASQRRDPLPSAPLTVDELRALAQRGGR